MPRMVKTEEDWNGFKLGFLWKLFSLTIFQRGGRGEGVWVGIGHVCLILKNPCHRCTVPQNSSLQISHHRPCKQESLTHPSQKFSNLLCWKYSISEQITLINSYFSALHDVNLLVIICTMPSLTSEWLASMMVLKASSKFDQRQLVMCGELTGRLKPIRK